MIYWVRLGNHINFKKPTVLLESKIATGRYTKDVVCSSHKFRQWKYDTNSCEAFIQCVFFHVLASITDSITLHPFFYNHTEKHWIEIVKVAWICVAALQITLQQYIVLWFKSHGTRLSDSGELKTYQMRLLSTLCRNIVLLFLSCLNFRHWNAF